MKSLILIATAALTLSACATDGNYTPTRADSEAIGRIGEMLTCTGYNGRWVNNRCYL